MLPMTLGDS